MHGTIVSSFNPLQRHCVTITGSGDHAVVLCHGYGCDQSIWQKVQPTLARYLPTVTLDLTGAGASELSHFEQRGRHATLAGYAVDLIEICDALPFKSLSFAGHSVGAMLGLLAAELRPQLFRELILTAPSPCYLNDQAYRGGFELEQLNELLAAMDDNFTAWADMLTPVIMGAHDPKHAGELARSFCRWNETAARHFARLTFLSDHRNILGSVKSHCLVLQCKDDAIAPAEVGKYMAEHLPNAMLMEMNNVGHCPHVTAPEETLNSMVEYLRYRGRLG